MVILISLATVLFTFMGGLFALRFKDKLHLVLGFSAGAVIGVAFFDLLPESLELTAEHFSPSAITSIIALGFLAFMLLDRFIAFYSHHDPDRETAAGHTHHGQLGAGSLSIHSFLDGLAIGLAFQVSSSVGIVVSLAVLVHDFSDGINTVGIILKNRGSGSLALRWLTVDAIAPALGALSSLLFSLTPQSLGIILALFCGFFLYIGASDLLPESHHRHPTVWTTIMTIVGAAILYFVVRFAGV